MQPSDVSTSKIAFSKHEAIQLETKKKYLEAISEFEEDIKDIQN